jgi:GT2 family glycosyltransferase
MTGVSPPVPALSGVAVVVVNYGSSALLAENLAGTPLGRSGVSVVVVDNRTTDGERRAVRRLSSENGWSLVEMDLNRGFGAGMNAGVRRARETGHHTFLLLNPDATIDVEGLTTLVAQVRADPMTMVSPVIDRPDGTPWFRGARVDVAGGRTRLTDGVGPDVLDPWLAGTCLVVHRDLWDLLGGFDEDYFLYWEDVDISWRCTAVGGRLVVRDDVRAVHSVGGTQGTSGKSPTYYYWNTRNRLLFAAQHLPRRDVVRWALRTPRYARDVLLRGGRRQFLRPLPPVSAAVRGSMSGLRIAARAWITGAETLPSTRVRGAAP